MDIIMDTSEQTNRKSYVDSAKSESTNRRHPSDEGSSTNEQERNNLNTKTLEDVNENENANGHNAMDSQVYDDKSSDYMSSDYKNNTVDMKRAYSDKTGQDNNKNDDYGIGNDNIIDSNLTDSTKLRSFINDGFINDDPVGKVAVHETFPEETSFVFQEDSVIKKSFKSLNATSGAEGEAPEVYKSRWRSIRVMYYTMLVANVSLTIIFSSTYPFLQILDETVTTGFLGWVVASYSLGQLVAAPLLGLWSNLRGRALEPIFVSLAIKLPANILYMYLETIPSGAKYCMIVARTLVGIGSGNIAVVRSYVSGATTLDERTSAMVNMTAIQTLGFILGPLIQAAFVPIGYPGFVHEAALRLNMYTSPALLCVILDVINLALLIILVKEHRVPDVMDSPDKGTVSQNDDKPIDYFAAISSIGLFFCVMFSFIVMELMLAPLCMHMFAWTKADATLYVGIILGVAAILSVAVFIAVKFLAERFDERYLLLIGFVFFVVGYFFLLPWGNTHPKLLVSEENIALNQSGLEGGENVESTGCPDTYSWCLTTPSLFLWQVIVAGVLLSVGYPTTYVLCFSLFSKILGPKPQGVWMGWITATGSSARALGPVLVSKLYDAEGPRITFSCIVGLLIVTIVGLLLVFRRLVPFAEAKKPGQKDVDT